MSTDIPYVREELVRIALELNQAENFERSNEIIKLLPYMERTITRKGSPIKAVHITGETATAIKRMVEENPNMLYREIGKAFGVDGGRVSEIMTGERTYG